MKIICPNCRGDTSNNVPQLTFFANKKGVFIRFWCTHCNTHFSMELKIEKLEETIWKPFNERA